MLCFIVFSHDHNYYLQEFGLLIYLPKLRSFMLN